MMNQAKELRALIFDCNGTMIDDAPYHCVAWKDYLQQLGLRTITDEEFQQHIFGKDNGAILTYCYGHPLSEAETLQKSEEKEAAYRACAAKDPQGYRLQDGLIPLLNRMKTRHVPMNMATGSVYKNFLFYREMLGIDRWFDPDLVVFEDHITPSKPDPAFYGKAMKNLGVSPEACIVFEDSRTGIQAAVNAHAGAVVAITTTLPRSELKTIDGVTAIIDSFEEVTDDFLLNLGLVYSN